MIDIFLKFELFVSKHINLLTRKKKKNLSNIDMQVK